MKTFHRLTLPFDQAIWWRDMAKDCGLKAAITESVDLCNLAVTVYGEENEIKIAWDLFQEDYRLKLKL